MNDDKKKEIDEKVTEYYVEENERKYQEILRQKNGDSGESEEIHGRNLRRSD